VAASLPGDIQRQVAIALLNRNHYHTPTPRSRCRALEARETILEVSQLHEMVGAGDVPGPYI